MTTLVGCDPVSGRGCWIAAPSAVASLALVVAFPALLLASPLPPVDPVGPPALAATALQLAQTVSDEQEPQGRNVEAINVEGNKRLDAETILFFLATRVGAPYDWAQARQDFRSLLNGRASGRDRTNLPRRKMIRGQ